MEQNPIIYIVHCVDTEGPLNETLSATFERLYSIFGVRLAPTLSNLRLIQSKQLRLGGLEDAVALCFSEEMLAYNRNWEAIEKMLNEALSQSFRMKEQDDFGSGWVYSWHCMDHIGHVENPRFKDYGYGKVFRKYLQLLNDTNSNQDELNWHFHPHSVSNNPLAAATSYLNNYKLLLEILCRRVLEDNWFPVVNRPGFHAERPDSHAFLEHWIPFDFANQSGDWDTSQPDLDLGRFGNWSRAPTSWRGYHPHHDDYQKVGTCKRLIFRILNVGTRVRTLTLRHVREAFKEAQETGSAILAFADHDYRDIRKDVRIVQDFLRDVRREYPQVLIKYCGAQQAAISLMGYESKQRLKLEINLDRGCLSIKTIEGEVYGPQPFLAFQSKTGTVHHDNLDTMGDHRNWMYHFDDQTMPIDQVAKIGVGSAGRYGGYDVKVIIPS